MKDLIIIRGRNHYPQDVESTVRNCHPSFQGHDGAAFSESIDGQEGLVVIQEIGRHHHHDAETAVGAIRVAVAEAHEIAPSVVVLVRQGGVPKTSSGKIQRSACARAYVDGRLPVVFVWTDASAVHASGTAESVVDAPGSVDVGRPRSREDIENFLVERLSKGLAVSPDDVDLSQPFSALGLDSLRAVELVKDVESWIGRSLSPTVFWDYPTIAHLAGHLADARSESVALLDEARG
jgi:phthiocerol/phenolphthiocerol synthesis type-I polyketide synthase C